MASKIEILFEQDKKQKTIVEYDSQKDSDFIKIAKNVFNDRDVFKSFKIDLDEMFQHLVRLHGIPGYNGICSNAIH